MTQVGDRIRKFIAQELMFEDDTSKVTDDMPLLGDVLNSLGLIQLVGFMQEEFDITLDDADLTKDHFRTVVDIEHLVTKKASQG